MMLFCVAMGGAIGTSLRYLLSGAAALCIGGLFTGLMTVRGMA